MAEKSDMHGALSVSLPAAADWRAQCVLQQQQHIRRPMPDTCCMCHFVCSAAGGQGVITPDDVVQAVMFCFRLSKNAVPQEVRAGDSLLLEQNWGEARRVLCFAGLAGAASWCVLRQKYKVARSTIRW